MGLTIGQTPGLSSSLKVTATLAQRSRASSTPSRKTDNTPDAASDPLALLSRRDRPPLRVGFGQGTVSTPGAALGAVQDGANTARRLVPSAQELRIEQRERFAELRRQNTDRFEEFQRRRPEIRIPEPSAQARHFVNQVNEAASLAQARVSGQEIPAGRGRASIEVGGEIFTFSVPVNSATDPNQRNDTADRPRIDVRV